MNQDSSLLNHTAAIILAAGKGTRIGTHLPKVLYPIAGKPMIAYILQTLKEFGIKDIFVVTGYRAEDVQASIGDDAQFVYQAEQLGTGHALKCALHEIHAYIDTVLVMNGDDSAFYEKKTIEHLLTSHVDSKSAISLLTLTTPNPHGLGRIIRNNQNELIGIREEEDATTEEQKISEINVGCYVFNVDWVSRTLPRIKKSSIGEYYIGDTVELAIADGLKINSVALANDKEWIGVNTIDQLTKADTAMYQLIQERNKPTVYIVDNDNTLLNTYELKSCVTKSLEHLNSLIPADRPKIDAKTFWSCYDKLKSNTGWISLPDFSEEIAKIFNYPEFANTIKHMFYTLPFDDYVFPSVKDLLVYLGKRGKRIIFADGDLVYLPVKIKGMKIGSFIDDVFIFEQKDQHIDKIIKLFGEYRQVIIDDQIRILEKFKSVNPSATTIWIADGPYNKVAPKESKFSPDFTVNNIGEVESLIRNLN